MTLSASWCPGLTCNTLCSVFSQLEWKMSDLTIPIPQTIAFQTLSWVDRIRLNAVWNISNMTSGLNRMTHIHIKTVTTLNTFTVNITMSTIWSLFCTRNTWCLLFVKEQMISTHCAIRLLIHINDVFELIIGWTVCRVLCYMSTICDVISKCGSTDEFIIFFTSFTSWLTRSTILSFIVKVEIIITNLAFSESIIIYLFSNSFAICELRNALSFFIFKVF